MAMMLIITTACEPKVTEHGRQDLLLQAGNIIPKQMTKADILRRMGTPSAISQFGQDSWYYIAMRKETVAFFEPEIVKQEVLRITFQDDIVDKVEYYDDRQAIDVEIADDITPTYGQEYGFFEQLIGNIGKFNKNRRDPLSGG